MAISSKSFKGVPDTVALTNPWIAPGHPLTSGALAGFDNRNRAQTLFFDPWMLKLLKYIHSTVFVVLGVKDSGKSTFVKILVFRLMCLQAGLNPDKIPMPMTLRCNDQKINDGDGEYAPLVNHLEGTVVKLNKEGSINLFDHLMNMSELDIVETAINVAETSKGSQLSRYEPLAIQIAVYVMLHSYSRIASPELLVYILGSLTKQNVDDYFRSINTQLSTSILDKLDSTDSFRDVVSQLFHDRPSNLSVTELQSDGALSGQYVNRVLRGDYGNIFGGTRSLRQVLSSPVVDLDWTGVPPNARSLLESMLWKWQTIAMTSGDTSILPRINVGDEEHEVIDNLMHARFQASYYAKARALPTFDVRITQFLSQLTQAGSEGSELRAKAQQIVAGVGGYFIGQMPHNDDAIAGLDKLGISDLDMHILQTMPARNFGMKLPNRPIIFFQNVITAREALLVETNSASIQMTTRSVVDIDRSVRSTLAHYTH